MTQEPKVIQTVCYNHPDRETMLRCNRCDRPICTSCAVLTPTGYRCKECVRGAQKVFETSQWYDYPLAFGVAVTLSFIGSMIASFLGFFTLFIAPVAGVLTAEAVRWVVRRRRSKRLFQIATAGTILGALPLLAIGLLSLLGGGGGYGFFQLLWPGIYTFLVTSTVYYRLSGIQIR
jgi:hypothetical protein